MLEFRSLGTVVSLKPGRYGLKRRASILILSSYRVNKRIQGGGVGLDAKYRMQSLIRAQGGKHWLKPYFYSKMGSLKPNSELRL